MPLSLNEIHNGNHFEELVGQYFQQLNGVVNAPAIGGDGGIDVIVNFPVRDQITGAFYERKWIVQCKFINANIGCREIQTVNIPALIHSRNAVGYLLICKRSPTTTLTRFFEQLKQNCRFNYCYEVWTGTQFENRLALKYELHEQFFPNYWYEQQQRLINNNI